MKILSILMTKNDGIMASAQYENPLWQLGKCITEHQSRFRRKSHTQRNIKKNLSKIISDKSFSTLLGITA